MLVDKNRMLFVIDRAETAGIAGKRIHVQEHLVSNIMGKPGKVVNLPKIRAPY